jgi:hypothetical protein
VTNGQITGVRPFKDLIDVIGGDPVLLRKIRRSRHQTACFGEHGRLIDGREAVLCGEAAII